MARRNFPLPEEDVDFLESTGLEWETVTEENIKRVIIKKLPTPAGYKNEHADLNVRIEAAYPDTQIDMVYFYPPIVRIDNKPISATADDAFEGKVWQRWSRHRTAQNPWRPGLDNLGTHIALVKEWLNLELKK
jgi:hypothetical protein